MRRSARRPRIVIAFALASMAIAATSTPVLACSGPPLTFEEVIAGSELIVEGQVEDVLLDGLAYRLGVNEVFKGPPLGSTVRIGPETDSGGRGCEISLAEGAHVILGVVDITERLNSLATAEWHIAPDGSLSSPGSLWSVAADIEELREMLRQALPDTAQPQPGHGPQPFTLLLGFIATAVLAALARRRPRPAHR